jgi:hypothetical protein
MALSQGFVALGLVIGVGGLSVVMIRAVRERRRQIGMLRAMGLPARTVRRAFVLESGFVAARGLLIGGGLALLSCWLLASRSDALGERGIPFSAPWGTLSLCSRSRSSRPWRPRRSPPRERHASGRRWPSEWANEEPGGATPQGSAAF